jgi:uncharacterized membrane protein (DUF2068 family)
VDTSAQAQPNLPPQSAGMKAVIIYKGLIVLVLATISIISAFSWRHYDALATIAQDYLVDGEFGISAWLLKTVTHSQPHNLRLIARVSGIYAIVMGTATVGLWYSKQWANPLMIVMAGLPLPIEVLELLHQPSGKRLVILLLNALVVAFLLKHQFDRGQRTDGQLEESTS